MTARHGSATRYKITDDHSNGCNRLASFAPTIAASRYVSNRSDYLPLSPLGDRVAGAAQNPSPMPHL
jgi:hypothetical protein